MTRISIVTPVFNDPRVGRALDSILAQEEAGDIEIVVIDGGSSSPTQDVLASYAGKIDVLVSEPDRGIYDAMNKGVVSASGDVIGILNADDRLADPHVLRDVRSAFTDPRVGVSYGDILHVRPDGSPYRHWKAGKYRRWKLHLGWMPPHPGSFVRRGLYDRVGTFRLDLAIAADYEHQLRMFMTQDVAVAYIPRILVEFSTGGQSSGSTRKVLQGNAEVRQAWRLNGFRGGGLAPFLKPLQKVPQLLRASALPTRPRIRSSR